MIILETERLLIRDHIEEDQGDLFDVISRPVEMRFIIDFFCDH